jgi:hypothetical protein
MERKNVSKVTPRGPPPRVLVSEEEEEEEGDCILALDSA